jgi:RNA polymerase sigma-70 factor (ECF subfamily)
MARGPDRGLELVDGLVELGELNGYHLLHSTRAELLRRLGRDREASVEFARAIELATNDVDRRYLRRRLDEVAV